MLLPWTEADQKRASEALTRAAAGLYQPGDGAALMVPRAALAAGLLGTLSRPGEGHGVADVSGASKPGERAELARALLWPLAFAQSRGGASDAGALPLAGFVALAVVGVAAVAGGAYVASRGIAALDNALARSAAAGRLQKLDGRLIELAAAHAEAEEAAGKALPLSDAEKAILAQSAAERLSIAGDVYKVNPPENPWKLDFGASGVALPLVAAAVAVAYLMR